MTISDAQERSQLELDAVAIDDRGRILAIAEAKASTRPVHVTVLARLERARSLLGDRADEARLLVFAQSGFTAALRTHARSRPDVDLVDLTRLYEGD
jgi:hypothetical protein